MDVLRLEVNSSVAAALDKRQRVRSRLLAAVPDGDSISHRDPCLCFYDGQKVRSKVTLWMEIGKKKKKKKLSDKGN